MVCLFLEFYLGCISYFYKLKLAIIMAFIFDGRAYFSKKIDELKRKIATSRLEVPPKLASILVQPSGESVVYTNLKKRVLAKLGGELVVYDFRQNISRDQIACLIDKLNKKKTINGIMIQLPLPSCFSIADRDFLVERIDPLKDVDGMRKDSFFVNPAACAVFEIIKYARNIVRLPLREAPCKVVVLGARGFEGNKIVSLLSERGFDVVGLDKSDKKGSLIKTADIVVSATGSPGIVGASDIKKGSIVIDLGYPEPDVRGDVIDKASFVTPVPGGVGPLTIYFLMENLFCAFWKNGS